MAEKSLTGIILAGGQSKRMGQNKALITIGKRKCIEHILTVVEQVCDKVMIIANSSDFDYLEVDVYKDIIKDSGPLGGIYTGLSVSSSEKNLILACDTPFVTQELLYYLCEFKDLSEIVLPYHDGRLELLCGVYSKCCINRFVDCIEEKQLRMKDVVKRCIVQEVSISSSQGFYNPSLFFNINSPIELNFAQEEIVSEN